MNEEPFTPGGATTVETHPGAPHLSGSPLQEKAGQTAQSFQSETQRLKETAREQGTAAMSQVREGLQSATRQAQEAGKTFFRNQQETLAARISEYAQAARSASGCMHGEHSNLLAMPAERAADGLERLSGYLREKQPADLLLDLESFARRRPEVVFGGLFIAGLAAARFLKASRRDLEERQRSQALVPTIGPGTPLQADFGATPVGGVGTTVERTFPSSSPATSSIPPATGSSPSASSPLSQGSTTDIGNSSCGCPTTPENLSGEKPVL